VCSSDLKSLRLDDESGDDQGEMGEGMDD
jgi:hypothetical protein